MPKKKNKRKQKEKSEKVLSRVQYDEPINMAPAQCLINANDCQIV
jgi:hypothetical protein